MEVFLRYGKVRVRDAAPELDAAWRPSEVVDGVLGLLRDPEDVAYRKAYMLVTYHPLWQPRATAAQLNHLATQMLEATERANRGAVAIDALTEFLPGVRIVGRGTADVSNFAAFAAWAFVLTVEAGWPFELRPCANCGIPFLSSKGAEFCSRPAPFQATSCRALAHLWRHTAVHADYHRERRRLYERMRRGTFSRRDYERWLAANRPDNWTPYESWIKKGAHT